MNNPNRVIFQTLEKHLIEKNAGSIFVESKALGPDEHLSTKSRIQLVQLLVDFMYQVYGQKIKQQHKVDTAKATVTLFPCLKFAGTELGIVSFIYLTLDFYIRKMLHTIFVNNLMTGTLVQFCQWRLDRPTNEELPHSREKKVIVWVVR